MEKKKAYFPLFADLSKKRILVVGGGKIAARRVRTLVPFCDQIKVVAPEISEEIKKDPIQCLFRMFLPEDLEGADLVLAATNDPSVDEKVWLLCHQKHIPVNIASDRSRCDFYFPGILQDGNVVVGITASGENHRQAKEVREKIESVLFSGQADRKPDNF